MAKYQSEIMPAVEVKTPVETVVTPVKEEPKEDNIVELVIK